MKYLKIRIELGTSDSVFDIYYDSIGGGTRALLYDTGLPAIGLTNEDLELGEGVTVSVPDNATSIILTSDPKAFCSEIPGFNNETYTIPIGCISYTVSASAGIFNYFYTDCNCNPVTATIDATYGYTEETFCALQDSVSAGPLTVVNNGYCLTPTPTQTSTPINTPTQTPTPTSTPTPTQTPSSTPPCNTIFTHGALRNTCGDFCNINNLIQTTDCASETYFNLSIGDFIYGYSGQTGFLAYSNVSTDTNTGPFRIAEIDGTGEILGLYVCSGGSCIPL
jgi:hypothetical protein